MAFEPSTFSAFAIPLHPLSVMSDAGDTPWTCTWETGPDAGGTIELTIGRHLVGRASDVPVRCDDPALEVHHALIDVVDDTVARLIQLCGRAPLVIGGDEAATVVELADRALIEIGRSTLRVRRSRATCPDRSPTIVGAHLRHGALIRGPRAVPSWTPAVIEAPAAPERIAEATGGIVPAMIGLAAAGVVAVALNQPMFLIFGALGAVVAAGTWATQRTSVRRRRAHARRTTSSALAQITLDAAAQCAAFTAHLLATTTTAATARTIIERRDLRLWERRAADPDAFAVSLGTGEVIWRPTFDATTPHTDEWNPLNAETIVRDLPIVTSLGRGARTAIHGPGAAALAVARAAIVQLAADCGPADLRVAIVTERPDAWVWAAALPHMMTGDGASAIVAGDDLGDVLAGFDQANPPHLLIVTDAPHLLNARTSALRRALTGRDDGGPALLALVDADRGVPHICTAVLAMTSAPIARWVPDTTTASLPQPIRFAGIGARTAAALCAALVDLSDPDDPLGAASAIPAEVGLAALLAADGHGPLTGASVAMRWRAGGANPTPWAPIGLAADGTVDIDLGRDGPHGLIAGTTGAGKSELLRSMVAAMAVGASPDHVTFVLVDYKGGATFDACAALPHVVGVVTDLDAHLADRALRCLHAELRRREARLREHGAADLGALHEIAPDVVMPRLVVVVDEFAALVAEQPTFLHALVGIAQRGRSLGVHLLLATQRPNGVISDEIRANTNIRIALRLHDAADALDVLGDAGASLLPRRRPGRAMLRLGPGEYVTFQAARCTAATPSGATELDLLVRAVRDACRIAGTAEPHSPWRPALPSELTLDDVDGDAIGLVDDPDEQRQFSLRWSPADGHVLIAGAAGSGATSALLTLATSALSNAVTAGTPTHIYVIDAIGDRAFDGLADHPSCAAVVRLHERERLMRVLHRLAAEVTRRCAAAGRGTDEPRLVVLIDGYVALRRSLDDVDTADQLDTLDHLVNDSHNTGVHLMLAVDQTAGIPAATLACCRNRWVLHLLDPTSATVLGVPARDVPAAIPGRIALGDSMAAQLRRPTGDLIAVPAAWPTAAAVECLPHAIDASSLPAANRFDAGVRLPLGRQFASGDVATLEVPDGEHVMIIGPARSGRSGALAALVRAWRDADDAAHGGPRRLAWIGVLAPRRTDPALVATHGCLGDLLAEVPAQGAALIAIDDADVIDDPGGALAALAASRRAGLVIAAVGAPDALRQTYGHWTAVVRRSRLGLALAGSSDVDGDMIGATLPRRLPIPARPGLAWLVATGTAALVQLATVTPANAPTAHPPSVTRPSSSAIRRLPATIR